MPGLRLIVGPPNSGRAREVRERLEASAGREPVLVVPTGDDALRFERDLCPPGGAVVGTRIRTFEWLVEDAAAATTLETPPPLSQSQRLALVREAARGAGLRLLARSARRQGFAGALERLISELQAALVTPDELKRKGAELDDGGALERELAAAYGGYLELRDAAGRTDRHSLAEAATAALRRAPHAWEGRPVFLYAFDDFAREQLELIGALANATDITVAVNYADKESLAARAELRQQLVDDLGATVEPELPFDGSYTASRALRHLDQFLFDPDAEQIEPDPGLAMLESSGERGEAEAIGIEIAKLIAAGSSPDELVIVLRHPDRHGDLYRRVLGGMGIPIAVEGALPLARSAVGRGLVAAVRASGPEGTAADVLALLRADLAAPPGIADFLERRIGRSGAFSAAEAIESWANPPAAIAVLRDSAPGTARLRALARLARTLAELPHQRLEPVEAADHAIPLGDGSVPAPPRERPFDPLELRAARIAAATLEELAGLTETGVIDAPSAEEAVAALEDATVPLWRGPTDGRVRVISPYRARAARATNLFVASLQDGEFPAASTGDPLLGDARRAALGIAELVRREPGKEERYLFHACASRPTERLWLSWRSSDEDGSPLARSPLVDDVLDLLSGDPELARRGVDQVVPGPGEATTLRGLARSLSEVPAAAQVLRSDGLLDAQTAERLERAIAAARERDHLPGPFRHPLVLARLAERNPVGAGTIEKWIDCPFRWLVDHELKPVGLEPAPEPLTAGSIVHEVLELLYREAPGADSIPREADLATWQERAVELLDETAERQGLADGRPLAGVVIARIRAQIERFLAREAKSQTHLRPDPELLEATFGEGTDVGPLVLGDLELHGQIDRIDVGPDREGVVHDYKTSSKVTAVAKLEDEGKLQLQLYARAARDLFGVEPVGGLYHPLASREEPKPRGFVLDGPETEGVEVVRTDRLDADELAETLEAGVERARDSARAMRDGKIDRLPNGGACPSWCRYQPICRLERTLHADAPSEREPSGRGVPE